MYCIETRPRQLTAEPRTRSSSLARARVAMRRDATRGTHAPSTVRASSLPPRVVDDIAALAPALTAASAAVESRRAREGARRSRRPATEIARAASIVEASRRAHARVQTLERLRRGERARQARGAGGGRRRVRRAGRVAYGGDALVMPARASADECMRALYASCALLDELRGASEACVEAFAGQLARGYFMPLSATATACASRVRCESSRAIEELVKAYNVVARVRESLPPPGRFGSAKGEGGNGAVAVAGESCASRQRRMEARARWLWVMTR